MIPVRDSMVDVQSPQQALRAYSRAKEYAWCILCDALDRRPPRRTSAPPASPSDPARCSSPRYEQGTAPGPRPPHGAPPERPVPLALASHGAYPSTPTTPAGDRAATRRRRTCARGGLLTSPHVTACGDRAHPWRNGSLRRRRTAGPDICAKEEAGRLSECTPTRTPGALRSARPEREGSLRPDRALRHRAPRIRRQAPPTDRRQAPRPDRRHAPPPDRVGRPGPPAPRVPADRVRRPARPR